MTSYHDIITTPEKPAIGGKEYRVRSVDFDALTDLETSMRATDLARIHNTFDEYGRRITVKKEKFAEIIDEWPIPDVYVTMRVNTDTMYPHPDRNQQYGENLIKRAVKRAFDIDADELEDGIHEEGTLSRYLKARCEDRTLDTGEHDVKVAELYELALHLTEMSSESDIEDDIFAFLDSMKAPWVLTQMLNNDFSTYIGRYMMIDGIAMSDRLGHHSEDRLRDAWDVCYDAPMVFIDAEYDMLNTVYKPHSRPAPMKAKSDYDASDIPELQESGNWVAQTKYDGTRVSIHHDGDGDIRAYFGCGGKDVTAVLPEIHDLPLPDDIPFIFDSEATPYDAETGEVLPFQHILKRTSRAPAEELEPGAGGVEVRFKFFDCMYWHGNDIRERKFEDRFQVVRNVFDPPNVARQGEDLEATFHRSIESGHEGVILKKKGHEFQLNTRSSDWQKWKAQPETLDVQVTDAERGGGKFSDRVGALHIGVKHDGKIVDVGSVGTGFGEEERLELWREYEAGELVGQTIQVSFEELQVGAGDDDDVDTAWALRFPSYDHKRPDGEVDTLERAAELDGKMDLFEAWRDADEPADVEAETAEKLAELMD